MINMNPPPILISRSAYQSGGGRSLHKYVCGLGVHEREVALSGSAIIAFESEYRAYGKHGTKWRVCKVGPNRRLYPRVPTPQQLLSIRAIASAMARKEQAEQQEQEVPA